MPPQELLLKCNTGTQKYIDSIEARKAKDAADGVEAMDVDSKEGEKPAESAAELDNKALETIMGLVSADHTTCRGTECLAVSCFGPDCCLRYAVLFPSEFWDERRAVESTQTRWGEHTGFKMN